MAHFTPTYKLSSDGIGVLSYNQMSEHDQIIRSFQQGNLTNSEYFKSIIKNSEHQLKTKIKSDRELAGNQINALQNIFKSNLSLENSLNEGFDEMYSHLGEISSQLHIHHTALIEQYKISNTKLETIEEYIKLPESEKERLFLIETAMEFLRQTFISNERYPDALKYFLQANELNDGDYIVLKQIGLIYLYGEDLIDLEKAIEYLHSAFSYAHSAQKEKEMGVITKHLAYAYFLCGEIRACIDWADTSLSYVKDLGLLFIKAEALMMFEHEKDALDLLEELANIDLNFIKESENKEVFNGKLDGLITKISNKLNEKINEVTFEIEKLLHDGNSDINKEFIKVNTSISKPNVTIYELEDSIIRFDSILSRLGKKHEVKTAFYNRIAKLIEDNTNDLYYYQIEELEELLEKNPREANVKLSHYLNQNIAETTEIAEKFTSNVNGSLKIIAIYVFLFGTIGSGLLFYLNYIGQVKFFIPLLAALGSAVVIKLINRYTSKYKSLYVILFWLFGILSVAKFVLFFIAIEV